MARGRFISKEITIDKKVNSLSDPWSMLAFTWLLTHADREGRIYGDPILVKSLIFPRQPEITVEDMTAFITEWAAVGLIDWYEVDDEMYIYFPNFEKHQVGLRKEKEQPSVIPPPLVRNEYGKIPAVDGKIPAVDGKIPAEVKEKLRLREVKGEEEDKGLPPPAPAFQFSQGWQIRVFTGVTNLSGIPGSDMPKVMEALDSLRSRFTSEDELVTYLKPYFENWITRKTRDGRKYSKSNCAWLYDMALAEDTITAPKLDRVMEVFHAPKYDPDCERCHGKGKYMSEKSGRYVECDCLKVYAEVEG